LCFKARQTTPPLWRRSATSQRDSDVQARVARSRQAR